MFDMAAEQQGQQTGRFGLSGFQLKWIALATMLIDHIGYIFYGQLGSLYYWFRYIGRIAFPVFGFLLVEGFIYTKSRQKYALRLGVFCLVSEPCFDLAFHGALWNDGEQNVFFTLFIGFCTIWLVDYLWNRKVKNVFLEYLKDLAALVLAAGLGCFLAVLLKTDYSYKGILVILGFYLLRRWRVLALVWMYAVLWAGSRISDILQLYRLGRLGENLGGLFSLKMSDMSFLAFFPILLYNGQKGRGMKWLFYFFYPVHLLLLYGLHELLIH